MVDDAAFASGFLGRGSAPSPQFHLELEHLFAGHGELLARRFESVEAAVQPDFDVSPENAMGRLSLVGVRPIARGYFAKEHGWVMKGLEPVGLAPPGVALELHEIPILRQGIPKLAQLLHVVQTLRHGLSLGDMVSVVVALEWLTLRSSLGPTLDAAYRLNGWSPLAPITEGRLREVCQSYLLLFREGNRANLVDAKAHMLLKQNAQSSPGWHEITAFVQEAIQNTANFEGAELLQDHGDGVEQQLTRRMVEQVVIHMALRYGKFQNKECHHMKADLLKLDPNLTGFVPLDAFHKLPVDPVYGYSFHESADYLRRVGALRESVSEAPRVIIPNYLTGPTNCIAATEYTAVCCLNECEVPLTAIERQVRAKIEFPDRLLQIAEGISTGTVPSLRHFTPDLGERLQALAGMHHGTVALRSTGFAHWLSAAFPYECPTPLAIEADAAEEVEERTSAMAAAVAAAALAEAKHGQVPMLHLLGDENCTRRPVYVV